MIETYFWFNNKFFFDSFSRENNITTNDLKVRHICIYKLKDFPQISYYGYNIDHFVIRMIFLKRKPL